MKMLKEKSLLRVLYLSVLAFVLMILCIRPNQVLADEEDMAVDEAPTIVGAFISTYDFTQIKVSWENSDRFLKRLSAIGAAGGGHEYLMKSLGLSTDRAADIYFYVQVAYSFDGENWINDTDRDTKNHGFWGDAENKYQEEGWAWSVELPTFSAEKTLSQAGKTLLDLDLDMYDDTDQKIAEYLSQGKAELVSDSDGFDVYVVDLGKNTLYIKARYVVAYGSMEEGEEGFSIKVSYSPWSEIFAFNNKVTPTSLKYSKGGSFDAPAFSLVSKTGEVASLFVLPDSKLKQAIAQYHALELYGRYNYYGNYLMDYWYWNLELQINDGDWFHYKGVDATEVMLTLDCEKLAVELKDLYDITLQPNDSVKARVRLLPSSADIVYLEEGKENSRFIYAPYEGCGVMTPYSEEAVISLARTYAISYDLGGGSFMEGTEQITRFDDEDDAVIDLLEEAYIPVREGYTFDGWYETSAFTEESKIDTVDLATKQSYNLYAKWIENTILITFDVNGGSRALEPVTKGVWTPIKLPAATSTMNGYVFYAWNERADGKGEEYKCSEDFNGKQDMTLYAQWRLKFTDVKYGTWQYNTAKFVFDNKIIQGTTATTFSPNSNLSRAQFIVMLWRMEGQPKVEFNDPYSDCYDGKFYSTAIQWAKNKGLAAGMKDGTFHPNDPVTREQFVTFLYRYAKYKGYDTSTNGITYTECKDADMVNKTFELQVEWAYERGFIAATKEITPRNSITRIQAAAIFERFVKFYK